MRKKPSKIKMFHSMIRQELRDTLRFFRYRAAWDSVDYFFLSHQKTGRTWVRVFLAKYFELQFNVPYDPNFKLLENPLHPDQPKMYFTHSGTRLNSYEVKLFIRLLSRTALARYSIRSLRGKRIIFLVRDPRDTALSWYYHLTYRDGQFDRTLSDFLRDPQYGITSIIGYMNQYVQHRDTFAQFTVFRYEDLKVDPLREFRRMIQALGVPVSENMLEKLILDTSFENMKRMAFSAGVSKVISPTDKGDPRTAKVRKGKIGAFREEFSPEDIAFANAQMEFLDPQFGYEV